MERSAALPVKDNVSKAPTLVDRLAALRRRRRPALIVAIVVLSVALAAAALWPATYRSTATILIEQQEVPVDLVRSMISSYADQRIQVITQRVMTTENLMRIIDRYSLYAEDRQRSPREELLERMRTDIKFSMISADVVDPRVGRPTKATIAFSVSYDNRSAVIAARVANELASLYLNENLTNRKQLADDTATFLTTEADHLSKQMTELDAALAQFKERNVDNLPELGQLNVQMLARTEEELRETDARIRSLDQQAVYLEAQLAQLQPEAQIYTGTGERVISPSDRLKILKSDYARANALYAPDHPDVLRMQKEIAGLETAVGKVDTGNDLVRQLRDAQSQLAAARQRYAPDHPDVVQLERLVTAIGAMMRDAPLTRDSAREQPDNPAYIQVSAQREAVLSERASLQKKRSALTTRIQDFETRSAQAPQIEREYAGLIRDLDNAQIKYREVRQKQGEAVLSRNLESERKGERFTLIEPPIAAEKPVSPNRIAILVLGALSALAAALGAIAVLETLDTRVRGGRGLEALLSVPPLAVIPWIETREEIASRTRTRRLSLAGAAGSVLLAIAALHLLYKPLDVLWAVAVRRLFS
jgi:succinoglycan biosynthesis transport protein ExoP